MSTIKRTVFYFHDLIPDGGLSFYEKIKKVHDLDVEAREFNCGNNNTCNFWYTVQDNALIGTIQLIRYVSPNIRTRGTDQSSAVTLNSNQGVNEKSHFVYNPNKSIFSFEYNHLGPKIGLLYSMVNMLYKENFGQDVPLNTFAYISEGKALERLEASYGIRTVQIRHASSSLSDNSEASSTLNKSLDEVLEFGNAKTIDITLKGEAYSKGILMSIRQFMSKFIPQGDQSLQNFEKLEVRVQRNETGGVEVIDLLKDKMLSEIQAIIVNENSRELNTQDFHHKMLRDMRDRELA